MKEENVESKQYYEEFIQRLIDETSNENHEKFLEKREKGENDSYICKHIRDDSVQEFIGYINRFNIPLSSTIKSSIYETNKLFDTDENLSLIDYAAFHGSIQIFRYLRMNNVQIGINELIYSIYSNKPEMIHLLEECHVYVEEYLNIYVLIEAIKCHHNDIANYLKNTLDFTSD